MNSEMMMRSGYFHFVERIQLFTDIGEQPLKNNFFELKTLSSISKWSIKTGIPVFSIIFACLITHFSNEHKRWRWIGREPFSSGFGLLRLCLENILQIYFKSNYSIFRAHYQINAPQISWWKFEAHLLSPKKYLYVVLFLYNTISRFRAHRMDNLTVLDWGE